MKTFCAVIFFSTKLIFGPEDTILTFKVVVEQKSKVTFMRISSKINIKMMLWRGELQHAFRLYSVVLCITKRYYCSHEIQAHFLWLFCLHTIPPRLPQQVNKVGYQGRVITLTHYLTVCILGHTAQLHYISAFSSLSKAEPAITPEYHQGVRLGNKFTERRKGREYHMWVRNMFSCKLFFFCFSCTAPP